MLDQLVAWTEKYFGAWGVHGLFWVSFMESSFFPIPPDLLIIPLVLARPDQWLNLAIICTIGSVLGSIFGYWLGWKFGLPLLKYFVKDKKIKKVHNYFQKYEGWTIGIAAFTPIPYKVFTIGAGVFYVNFKTFVFAATLGRGLRYALEAFLIAYYGQAVVEFLTVHFNVATIVLTILTIAGYYIWKKYSKSKD